MKNWLTNNRNSLCLLAFTLVILASYLLGHMEGSIVSKAKCSDRVNQNIAQAWAMCKGDISNDK